MSHAIRAGLILGALVAAWTLVMGVTGWYKDPSHTAAFLLVIVIEVAGLIWGLRQTAAQGRTYSGQVVAGTLMSIVAGVIIIGASLLFTTVAFPEYFEEIAAVNRQVLQQQGKSPSEIEAEVAAWAKAQTPLRQAMNGFLGTFVTGVVVSAVVGIWIRARPSPLRSM